MDQKTIIGGEDNKNHVPIKFSCIISVNIRIDTLKLRSLMLVFLSQLPKILSQFVKQVLFIIAEELMKRGGITCPRCNSSEIKWKSRNVKDTKIETVLGDICLPQMQVQCKRCERKFYLTRKLLKIDDYQRIPNETRELLGLLGSLVSFRIGETIASIFGATFNRMRIWRAVQWLGKRIDFSLLPTEQPVAEADGTGIAIHGAGKRGKEVKILAQHKKDGKLHIAGVTIDGYNQGWNRLFKKHIPAIKRHFPNGFFLNTDGDTSILKGLSGVRVIVQRCLWHIPHQFKYTLWRDKVKSGGEEWKTAMSIIIEEKEI